MNRFGSRRRRIGWLIVAAAYTILALLLLILGSPGVADDPLAMAPAILVAMPWTLLLRVTPAGLWPAMAVVILGIAINAGVLWWLALRPRKRAYPTF